MTFLDLFAGVGGFRRGMELAGHKCVGFCEWDKFAAASYTSMHLITEEQRSRLSKMDLKARQKEILKEEYRNGEWYSADVRLITGDTVPKCDCWCFGAPCQDFSVAGKRAGLEGDRSSLVREIFRILKEIPETNRPEWLIYENVKGMLSSNRGRDFGSILLEMGELGYDTEWQLFNTKNFGVPQNRERVYTVGHLRTRGRKQVFPLKGADGENSVPIEIIGHKDGYRRNTQIFSPNGCTEALDTAAGGGRGHHTIVPVVIGGIGEKNFGKQYREGNRVYDGTKIATALKASNVGNAGGASNLYSVPIVIPVLTPERAEKRQNGRRFKENGEPSFTLTSQDRHGVAVSIPIKEAVSAGYTEASEGDSINLTMPDSKTRRGRVGKKVAQTLDCGCNQGIIVKLDDNTSVYAVWYEKYKCYIAIRKLTPRECFRLQGWTDDYFEKAAFVNSDSQLYKQAGNGVTVNVVQTIGEAIKEAIWKKS